jgi:hypothetical protein
MPAPFRSLFKSKMFRKVEAAFKESKTLKICTLLHSSSTTWLLPEVTI